MTVHDANVQKTSRDSRDPCVTSVARNCASTPNAHDDLLGDGRGSNESKILHPKSSRTKKHVAAAASGAEGKEALASSSRPAERSEGNIVGGLGVERDGGKCKRPSNARRSQPARGTTDRASTTASTRGVGTPTAAAGPAGYQPSPATPTARPRANDQSRAAAKEAEATIVLNRTMLSTADQSPPPDQSLSCDDFGLKCSVKSLPQPKTGSSESGMQSSTESATCTPPEPPCTEQRRRKPRQAWSQYVPPGRRVSLLSSTSTAAASGSPGEKACGDAGNSSTSPVRTPTPIHKTSTTSRHRGKKAITTESSFDRSPQGRMPSSSIQDKDALNIRERNITPTSKANTSLSADTRVDLKHEIRRTGEEESASHETAAAEMPATAVHHQQVPRAGACTDSESFDVAFTLASQEGIRKTSTARMPRTPYVPPGGRAAANRSPASESASGDGDGGGGGSDSGKNTVADGTANVIPSADSEKNTAPFSVQIETDHSRHAEIEPDARVGAASETKGKVPPPAQNDSPDMNSSGNAEYAREKINQTEIDTSADGADRKPLEVELSQPDNAADAISSAKGVTKEDVEGADSGDKGHQGEGKPSQAKPASSARYVPPGRRKILDAEAAAAASESGTNTKNGDPPAEYMGPLWPSRGPVRVSQKARPSDREASPARPAPARVAGVVSGGMSAYGASISEYSGEPWIGCVIRRTCIQREKHRGCVGAGMNARGDCVAVNFCMKGWRPRVNGA